MRGARKLIFGLLGLVALGAGLWACLRNPAAGAVLFSPYAAAVVGIVGAVVVGNVGAHVAQAKAAATAGLSREELEKRIAATIAASRSGESA